MFRTEEENKRDIEEEDNLELDEETDEIKLKSKDFEWAKTCFNLGDQETSLSMLREAIKG